MKYDDLQALSPMQEYEAPKLPTLAEKPQLKKLPARWQKNAAVVACVGVVGTMTLASCAGRPYDWPHNGGGPVAPYYVTRPTEQETAPFTTMAPEETELDITVHHGGSGGTPFYVARLTEQEAMGIIRSQLEAAGLRFGDTPPEINVVDSWDEVTLDLYNAEHGVGIIFDNSEDSHRRRVQWGHRQTKVIEEDMPVGVFYGPWQGLEGRPEWDHVWVDWESSPPTEESKLEAVPVLRANLTEQVQTFIEFLQSEGILEH